MVSKKERIVNYISYYSFVFIGSFFSIISLCIYGLFTSNFSYYKIISKGEIFLISISVLSSSIYYAYNYSNRKHLIPKLIFYLSWLLYVIGIICYLILQISPISISQNIITHSSSAYLVLIFLLVGFTYHIQSTDFDVLSERKQTANQLEANFNKVKTEEAGK